MVVMAMMSAMTMNAQNEEGEMTLQVKGGVNISTMAGDPDAKSKVGYGLGLELEYGLSDMWGMSAGVMYSLQGAKEDAVVESQNMNMKLHLGYVNVPLLVQFYPVKGLALKTGLQLGFLASKKANLNGTKYDFDKLEALGLMPKTFRKVDLSIPLGVSYELEHFVLDARYNLGLTRIFKKSDNFPDSYRNSVIQITLGYKIDFGD